MAVKEAGEARIFVCGPGSSSRSGKICRVSLASAPLMCVGASSSSNKLVATMQKITAELLHAPFGSHVTRVRLVALIHWPRRIRTSLGTACRLQW